MWAHLLESALEPHPSVDIVLSTSWVQLRSFSRAQKALPEGLRKRVIGATWHSRTDPREWAELTRYQQIRRFLVRRPDAEWLAVDDDDIGWRERDRARLICTDPEREIGESKALLLLQSRLSHNLVGEIRCSAE